MIKHLTLLLWTLLIAPTPTPAADVTWTLQATTGDPVGFNGWQTIWYDPLSQRTIVYAILGNTAQIFSTDIFFYDSGTRSFSHLGGTGSLEDACPADTPTQPGDREPVWQMAVDTKRNYLWIYGGDNETCNDGTPPDTNPRQDMYYLQLDVDPLRAAWHQVAVANLPVANGTSAMVYDPDHDALFVFGSDIGAEQHDHWVYCRTNENPSPGVLTDAQALAGCAVADDWTEIYPAGGLQPPGTQFAGMVYDTVTKKVILYGGQRMDEVPQNQTWAYDVANKAWTQKALSTTAPPVYNGDGVALPAMVYNSATHKILYHQSRNVGAPADWQYDPVADTWTKLESMGGGTTVDQILAYDAGRNLLIGINQDVSTGGIEVWHGVLSAF
jgi:hypothetical protein